jgi:hypothetical protein
MQRSIVALFILMTSLSFISSGCIVRKKQSKDPQTEALQIVVDALAENNKPSQDSIAERTSGNLDSTNFNTTAKKPSTLLELLNNPASFAVSQPELQKLILEAGPLNKALDNRGSTYMELAVRKGQITFIEALAKLGAKVSQFNPISKKSLFDIAEELELPEVTRALKNALDSQVDNLLATSGQLEITALDRELSELGQVSARVRSQMAKNKLPHVKTSGELTLIIGWQTSTLSKDDEDDSRLKGVQKIWSDLLQLDDQQVLRLIALVDAQYIEDFQLALIADKKYSERLPLKSKVLSLLTDRAPIINNESKNGLSIAISTRNPISHASSEIINVLKYRWTTISALHAKVTSEYIQQLGRIANFTKSYEKSSDSESIHEIRVPHECSKIRCYRRELFYSTSLAILLKKTNSATPIDLSLLKTIEKLDKWNVESLISSPIEEHCTNGMNPTKSYIESLVDPSTFLSRDFYSSSETLFFNSELIVSMDKIQISPFEVLYNRQAGKLFRSEADFQHISKILQPSKNASAFKFTLNIRLGLLNSRNLMFIPNDEGCDEDRGSQSPGFVCSKELVFSHGDVYDRESFMKALNQKFESENRTQGGFKFGAFLNRQSQSTQTKIYSKLLCIVDSLSAINGMLD